MPQTLELSVVAKFVDRITSPMQSLGVVVDDAVEKFSSYDQRLRTIANQRGLISKTQKERDAFRQSRVELASASSTLGQYRQKQQALEPQLRRVSREINVQAAQSQTSANVLQRHKTITASLAAEQAKAREKVRLLKQSIQQSVAPSAELRAEHQRARQELTQVNALLSDQRSKQRAAQAAKQEDTAALKTLRSQYKAINREIKDNGRYLSRAEKQEASIKERRSAHAQALRRLRNELRQSGISTRNLRQEQARLGDQYRQTQRAAEGLAAAQVKANAASKRYDRALQRTANATIFAAGMQRVGRGIVDTVTNPLEKAVHFEDAMGNVDKYVQGADIDALKTQILDQGGKSRLGAMGIAHLVATGGQMGLDQAEAMDFARVSERIAVAFDIPVEEAGERIKTISSTLNLPIQAMESLGDAINHFGDNTKANASAITNILSRTGAITKTAGLNEREAAAMSALVREGSANDEMAATGMKNMLQALIAGDKAAETKQTQLEELGFDPNQVASAMQNDAIGIVRQVLGAIADQDAAKQGGIIEELFGRESSAVISSMAINLERFDEIMSQANDTALQLGSMEREYQREQDKTINKLRTRREQWNSAMIRLGDSLVPILSSMAEFVTPIVEAISTFIEKWPGLSRVVLGTVAVVGVAAMAFAPLITSIAALGTVAAWSAKRTAAANLANSIGGGFGGGRGKGFSRASFTRDAFKSAWGSTNVLKGAGGWLTAAVSAMSIIPTLLDSQKSGAEKASEVTQTASGIAGSLGGAKMGAVVGTMIGGPVGTAVGGALGGLVGFFAGDKLGSAIGSSFSDENNVEIIPSDEMRAKTEELTQTVSTVATAPVAKVTDNSDNRITVTISTTPGMSEQDIADAVVQKVETHQRRTQRKKDGGALYDTPIMSYL